MAKRLEDLTLDEIKAQMSIYQNLYQKKRREVEPEYAEKQRERDRLRYAKKKQTEGRPAPANKKYNHDGYLLVATT